MIHPIDRKSRTQDKPIEAIALPEEVVIPLSQHIGKPPDTIEASVEDPVYPGKRLASAPISSVSAQIHASVPGKVAAIENRPHPIFGSFKAIVIRTDKSILQSQKKLFSHDEIAKLSKDEIIRIVFEAGIVGMGGAMFPTHIKLNPPKKIDSLIINAAECEPYLTSDYRLMLEKTNEIILSIGLIQRCLNAEKVFIAIEDNKPLAIKKFSSLVKDTSYKVVSLKSEYPQGGEKQLLKNILKNEVPRGKLPFDIGAVIHNVATVYAIYEAVYLKKPLYERIVTVTGGCLANPKNLLVPIGTPIKDLIKACSPLMEEPAKIIMGGPMMGLAQYSLDAPVIKSTNGIVLLTKKQSIGYREDVCIRCGSCVRHCPVGLMPCLINLASEKNLWEEAKQYGASDCIECGCCNYVCSGNRRLVQSIKRAKMEIAK